MTLAGDEQMEAETRPVVVIAAAGRAKRFSGHQKVVAEVGGRPAVCRVAEVCERALGPHRQVVVVGHRAEEVRAALGEAPHRTYVAQEPLLGTGHALMTALHHLEAVPSREVFFVCGDRPLLAPHSLRRIRKDLAANGAAMVFLTGSLRGEPAENRQGRVLQACPGTPQAEVLAIVERATIDSLGAQGTARFRPLHGEWQEYTRDQLLAVREVNLSVYAWREGVLRSHLDQLRFRPEQGEYFVTDLVAVLRAQRLLVRAVMTQAEAEAIGIDTPEQLLHAEQSWKRTQPA